MSVANSSRPSSPIGQQLLAAKNSVDTYQKRLVDIEQRQRSLTNEQLAIQKKLEMAQKDVRRLTQEQQQQQINSSSSSYPQYHPGGSGVPYASHYSNGQRPPNEPPMVGYGNHINPNNAHQNGNNVAPYYRANSAPQPNYAPSPWDNSLAGQRTYSQNPHSRDYNSTTRAYPNAPPYTRYVPPNASGSATVSSGSLPVVNSNSVKQAPYVQTFASSAMNNGYSSSSTTMVNIPLIPNATPAHTQRQPSFTTVKFKPMTLVFGTSVEELIQSQIFPSSTTFRKSFSLTSSQASSIQNSPTQDKRVILRCCVYDRKLSLQSDQISLKLVVKVNHNIVYIGTNKKNPFYGPLDITKESLLDGATNTVEITAASESTMVEYGVNVILAAKAKCSAVLERLKTVAAYTRVASITKDIVKSKFIQTSDITCDTDSIKMSLICPISKQRIELPCFGSACEHLTFFNAQTFVELNQNKFDWNCPICRKPVGLDELRIDGLLLQVLGECKPRTQSIEFKSTGDWVVVEESAGGNEAKTTTTTLDETVVSPDVITIDSSDDEDEPPVPVASSSATATRTAPALTSSATYTREPHTLPTTSSVDTAALQPGLSSSSTDSEDVALSRRRPRQQSPRGGSKRYSETTTDEDSSDEGALSSDSESSSSSEGSDSDAEDTSSYTQRRTRTCQARGKATAANKRKSVPARGGTAKKRTR